MLEYTKIILNKVSFDKKLFAKELEKSFKVLEAKEIIQLRSWLEKNYQGDFSDVIGYCFDGTHTFDTRKN